MTKKHLGRPKGSKNKKGCKNRPVERTELPQDTSKTSINASVCKICKRVPFGSIVCLGFESWRHDDCAIGSQAWTEYFNALPAGSQKDVLAKIYQLFKGGIT